MADKNSNAHLMYGAPQQMMTNMMGGGRHYSPQMMPHGQMQYQQVMGQQPMIGQMGGAGMMYQQMSGQQYGQQGMPAYQQPMQMMMGNQAGGFAQQPTRPGFSHNPGFTQNPGFPQQNPGFPQQNPGFPQQNPGFPQTPQQGFAPQQNPGYRPPPPAYNNQMALDFHVKQAPTPATGQAQQPSKPDPASQQQQQQLQQQLQQQQAEAARQLQQQRLQQQQQHQQRLLQQQQKAAEVARQQQKMSTQRRLAELGRQGHKQVDPDSMIQAMFGGTDNVKKKQAVDPGPALENDDDFGDFGDFMSMPAEEPTSNGPPVENGAPSEAPLGAPEAPLGPQLTPDSLPAKKQDLTSMMMQCSDLTQPAKAKTFHKPAVKEIRPRATRQATFTQSDKAVSWGAVATDDLHSLFTEPKPEPTPPPASDDLLGGDVDAPSLATDAPAPSLPPGAPGAPTQLPHIAPAPSAMLPSTDSVSALPGNNNNPPSLLSNQNGYHGNSAALPGVTESTAHIPPLYFNTAAMPPVYVMVLEAVQGDAGIDTARVYPILLRSQLPREALGYIWSLANKTSPGRLSREELFMILSLVALAQNQVPFDSTEALRKFSQPPIPNLGQNDVTLPAPDSGTTLDSVPGKVERPTLAALNCAPEQDDFADFQQAADGFGEFVSSPKDIDPDETPTPVNDKFTFPEPVLSAPTGFATPLHPPADRATPTFDQAPPTYDQAPPADIPRVEHKIQDLHFEFDPCRGSDSSSMSSYAFDTQSRDSDTTKSDDFDDFHAADSYSSASSIGGGGAPAVALDARNERSDVMAPVTSLPPPVEDRYSVFRGAAPPPPVNKTEPVDEDFGSFKDATVLDSKVVDIKALVNNPNLYKPTETSPSVENKYDVFRTMETTSRSDVTTDVVNDVTDDWTQNMEDDSWADFASAEPRAAPSTEQIKTGESRPKSNYSPWRQNVHEFTPSSVALGDEPPELSTDDFHEHHAEDEFGHFSSAPADDLTPDHSKPENTPRENIFFTQHRKSHHVELSYGAMHDEPPEIEDHHFDEDFDDFSHYDGSRDHQPSSFEPTIHHTHSSLSRSIFDTEPPPLSPTGDVAPFPPSQSDHSLDSVPARLSGVESLETRLSALHGEDSQSVASLELPKPTRDDSQSLSSAGSDRERDGQSVQSLEFTAGEFGGEVTSPVDPQDVEEGFGEFSEAPVQEESSWLQQPKDAKEFMNAGVLLTDKYSAASVSEQAIERHAFEWSRCLAKSRDLIDSANQLFMDISNASVCNEVVQSVKGNDYIDNLIEVYRVTCRISLSITSTAASNRDLLQLLKDIDLGWNNLQGFIANSPLSPQRFDDKTSELKTCILRADDSDGQELACGVCLISVQAPGIHRLFYAGRQYHASCANLWLNCVDSTLPTLRLPELL